MRSRKDRSALESTCEPSRGGLESNMEREDAGRAEPESARGREKILCYINMQSPGRSSDLSLDRHLTRWPSQRTEPFCGGPVSGVTKTQLSADSAGILCTEKRTKMQIVFFIFRNKTQAHSLQFLK